MEPLIFNCWDSIGHIIASQWCARNPQIKEKGQNVVTAIAVDNHWMPIWMVPEDSTLQIHTFHVDVDFAPIEAILTILAEKLNFLHFAIHKIPNGLPEHVMCGAHAMAFIAHVVVQMALPEDLQELRTLHTNMRASFVANLYSLGYTPKPVVWANGASGESGQLPIMPVDETTTEQDAVEETRQRRLQMLVSHSYAMGNDEIDFQVQHLLDCHSQGPLPAGPIRHFITVSPDILDEWLHGASARLDEWKAQVWNTSPGPQHVIAVVLLHQHWIPFWIAPVGTTAQCHTLGDFAQDDLEVEQILRALSSFLDFQDVVIHRVPHGIEVPRLCGAMSICFLAHILLNTSWPRDVDQLRARCWDMKMIFAEAIQTGTPTTPTLWGWGISGESRLLPRMPDEFASYAVSQVMDLEDHGLHNRFGTDIAQVHFWGMGHHEMKFHLDTLVNQPLFPPLTMVLHDMGRLTSMIAQQFCSVHACGGIAFLFEWHWYPIVLLRFGCQKIVVMEPGLIAQYVLQHTEDICLLPMTPPSADLCGVYTWQVLAALCGFTTENLLMADLRICLQTWYADADDHPNSATPTCWGFGAHGTLVKNLAQELLKHGIPENAVEERAVSAIKALGSEQILQALAHRQSWKQLKMLGNNSKFQFVLPSELAKAVENNKGKPIGPKGKGKGPRNQPAPAELDPAKLLILDGSFHCQGHVMQQLTMKQIGPVSSGVILMSLNDAEPYLRAGVAVSREPLALLVLHRAGAEVQTALPHSQVTVPCRCTVNNEPVLAAVVMVQLGAGFVEKANGPTLVSIDTPEVVTLKVLVYKDELPGDWNEFCSSPIRCLVSLLPKLKRCMEETCTCPAWHNTEKLPLRDPILDVWRRQFLRSGFKPCPASKADMFSVCIRIPMAILEAMLNASGTSGAYCEPRTADGTEILSAYTVVWTTRHSLQEMQHLMQTNPAVTGLARLGERRGLRVHTTQAKAIHQLVRPDTVFFPNGPKNLFTVGPFPYGVDRQAVAKVLRTAGWECRPLQPTNPCPGRGVMWTVQATVDPENTIVATTSGEIVITKQKHDQVTPSPAPTTVGSADTLALCGTVSQPKQVDGDPWVHSDPWRSYHTSGTKAIATAPTEGMQQIEERIQSAVLAKMQVPMEDDLPDRVQTLEGQVHQLLAKQQGLESQFHEYSGQHTQQIHALQTQVTAQAQQLHGHLENQNQNMQSLFEQQMQQIRGLLAKRPRDEGLE